MRYTRWIDLVFILLGTATACGDSAGPSKNHVPTANAGADQLVATAVTITLDGSGSHDSDRDPLTYLWTQVSGPVVSLSDPTAEAPTFTSPRRLATLEFSLAVSDADTTSTTDAVAIVIDRFTQVPIASDLSVAISDPGTPGKLASIAVGENILIISCRVLGSPAGLFGTLVDTTGAVLKTIPISPHSCEFPQPSVASNGSIFLIVFQRAGEIVATRLTGPPAFSVAGEAVISTGSSNFFPAVASGAGGFFVAWNSFQAAGYDIYGAKLGANGQSAGEQPVFVETGEQIEPAIAFDGVNFLVIWRDTRSGSGPSADTDIYGTRVSATGSVLDPSALAISTAPNMQGEPNLTFDGTNYLAVWSDARRYPSQSQPAQDVFGTRISPDGDLLDGAASSGGFAISAVASTSISYTSAEFDGTNFLISFAVDGFHSPAGVYLARVSRGGALLDRSATQLGPSISGVPATASRPVYPVVVSTSARTVVAWVDNTELGGEAKDVVGW
jgi:hypothetical protein